jgi:hypothetical protein
MANYPALDVAIGLVFLYIVLALLCSTINESIATAIGLRARYLQLGLLNLFSGSSRVTQEGKQLVDQFYNHPLVQGLIPPKHGEDPSLDPTAVKNWWRKPPFPSYVPSRTFAVALTDMASGARASLGKLENPTPEQQGAAEAAQKRMEQAADDFERTLAAIPNAQLSEAMVALYHSVGSDAGKFTHAAEEWFDDTMERVSGWYKRRVHWILLGIAIVIIVLINADTLAAGRVFWRDDAVRASVVKQAETVANGTPSDTQLDQTVRKLDLPLGWHLHTGDQPTEIPNDPVSWIAKLLGLALTIGAVMLGAPFWFDVLSKFVRVRGTGAPPPATDSVRSGEGEQRRGGSRGRTA